MGFEDYWVLIWQLLRLFPKIDSSDDKFPVIPVKLRPAQWNYCFFFLFFIIIFYFILISGHNLGMNSCKENNLLHTDKQMCVVKCDFFTEPCFMHLFFFFYYQAKSGSC